MDALRPLPLLLLSGCWLTGPEIADVIASDADTDADTDADADADADVDVFLDVTQGAAGDVVTLTGGPFDGDAEVRFGGARAGLDDVSDDTIVATVPSGDEGFVDVTVQSSAGSGVADEPFFRWELAAGSTTALGEVGWYDYVGTYWYNTTPVDDGYAAIHFLRASALAASDLYGPSGVSDTCVNGYQAGLDTESYPAFGDALAIVSSNNRRIEFTFDGDLWENANISPSAWASGPWRLEAEGTADAWPPLEVADFTRTPDPFNVAAPAIAGSEAPVFFDFLPEEFAWSTSGAGDFVVIDLTRYDGSDQVAEHVSCVVEDDGSFFVPVGVWDGWDSGYQMTVMVGRVMVTEVALPTGGSSQVAGVRYVVGAGFQI